MVSIEEQIAFEQLREHFGPTKLLSNSVLLHNALGDMLGAGGQKLRNQVRLAMDAGIGIGNIYLQQLQQPAPDFSSRVAKVMDDAGLSEGTAKDIALLFDIMAGFRRADQSAPAPSPAPAPQRNPQPEIIHRTPAPQPVQEEIRRTPAPQPVQEEIRRTPAPQPVQEESHRAASANPLQAFNDVNCSVSSTGRLTLGSLKSLQRFARVIVYEDRFEVRGVSGGSAKLLSGAVGGMIGAKLIGKALNSRNGSEMGTLVATCAFSDITSITRKGNAMVGRSIQIALKNGSVMVLAAEVQMSGKDFESMQYLIEDKSRR